MPRKSSKPALVTDLATNPSEMATMNLDIAALAYQLWQDRGCPQGSSDEDWYEAERKLQLQTETRATTA